MTTFGMTSTGFVQKRLADIIDSLNAKLQTIVDPTTGETLRIDPGEVSVITQIRDIFASELASCWENAALAYLQFDPLYNTGAGQSGTVQLNAITRKPGAGTIINITMTGTDGTAIPQGFSIGTTDKKYEFTIDQEYTIGSEGTVTGTATCTTYGAIDPEVGSVAAILTPTTGWTAVTNTSTASLGTLEETDEELRIRQQVSTSATSYRQIDAIYSAIYNIPGVTYCRVYQNTDTSTDGRGIPAKTIAVVALGGDDETIANAMFFRVPIGIAYHGNTTVTLTDKQGFSYDVKFQRPTEVPINVEVDISSVDNSFPSSTYETDITNAIINFAQYGAGKLGCQTNFDRNGFPPGDDIIISQLYLPVLSVPGLKINSLKISKDTDPLGTSDIDIAWDEVGQFTAENIDIILS